MARLIPTAIALLTLVSVAASPGYAIDHPAFGQKIVLKRSSSGKEKLVVLLKDPALLFPAIGGPDDPSALGMTVTLFAGAGADTATLTIPAGLGKPGWKTKESGGGDSYKFGNREAPIGISPVRVALLREGRLLKIVAKDTGLLLGAPQQSVGVRVVTGSLRNCALFTTPFVQRDEAGQFKARKAPAPVDCEDHTLADLPAPVCGDGTVNGGEACDGVGTCPTPGDECIAAGEAGECTCCDGPCVPTCGDGFVNGAEECDGIGTCPTPGDECVASGEAGECTCCDGPCVPTCGDGFVNGAEECDGGGTCPTPGDECAAAGEAGECTCCDGPCTPTCGDGFVNGAEECDGVGTCPTPGDECAVAGAAAECTCCNGPCPEACGDGIANGAEECDGLDLSGCTDPLSVACRPAGFPGECTCCGGSCTGLGGGCCAPSVVIPAPGLCVGACLSTSCAPPFTCPSFATCLPDETCCAPAGAECYSSGLQVSVYGCCAGTLCGRPTGSGVDCCAPDGLACASDDDCCSDACGAGGTCDTCLANGTACTDPLRCCSRNCGASGTCECAPVGGHCVSSSQCCSGSCSGSSFTCLP